MKREKRKIVKKHGKTDNKTTVHKADADETEPDEATNSDNTDNNEVETTVSNLSRIYELSSAEVLYMSE